MRRSSSRSTFIVVAAVVAATLALIALGLVRLGGLKKSGGGRVVARVDIIGPILESRETVEEVKKHRKDPRVGALVVLVDSPGGAVAPSQEIYRELLKTREEGRQKVVAAVGNLGASGGYYIASAADRIYASPGSLVGSIGVLMELTKFGELLEKVGVGSDVIKSGPYKDIGSPLRETTGEERALLQGLVDDTHRQFVEAVAEARGMDLERVGELADGRIFTGSQALGLGLVDELGGLEDALAGAAALAGIEGEPTVIGPAKKRGLRYLLDSTARLLENRFRAEAGPRLMFLWRP